MREDPEAAAQRLRGAWQGLEQAGRNLLYPSAENLDAACGDLELARSCLEQLAESCRRAPDENRAAIREGLSTLRGQLDRVRALLEQAGGLRLGWARLLAAMVGGYTREGTPAPLTANPSLSVEG